MDALTARSRVVLYATGYWVFELDVIHNVLALRRSAEPIADMDEFVHQASELARLMEDNGDVRGIVVDMRLAKSRHDMNYELATRQLREMTYATFRRVVVLCTTAAGVLQVRRLSGDLDAARHLVTTDEAQAFAFASVRQSTRPPPRIVEAD